MPTSRDRALPYSAEEAHASPAQEQADRLRVARSPEPPLRQFRPIRITPVQSLRASEPDIVVPIRRLVVVPVRGSQVLRMIVPRPPTEHSHRQPVPFRPENPPAARLDNKDMAIRGTDTVGHGHDTRLMFAPRLHPRPGRLPAADADLNQILASRSRPGPRARSIFYSTLDSRASLSIMTCIHAYDWTSGTTRRSPDTLLSSNLVMGRDEV